MLLSADPDRPSNPSLTQWLCCMAICSNSDAPLPVSRTIKLRRSAGCGCRSTRSSSAMRSINPVMFLLAEASRLEASAVTGKVLSSARYNCASTSKREKLWPKSRRKLVLKRISIVFAHRMSSSHVRSDWRSRRSVISFRACIVKL